MMISKCGNMQRYSKESVTFRLDSPNLSSITKEAEKKGISLNALVNQIVDKHVDWHSFSSEANLVSFPHKFISKLLSKYTEEEIANLARKIASEEIKDIVLLLRKKTILKHFWILLKHGQRFQTFHTHTILMILYTHS